MARYEYLEDPVILDYIYTLIVKDLRLQIIILDRDDIPIKAITGKATGGSISVNGKSAVRRSGSVTLATDPFDTEEEAIHQVTNISNLIALNKRVSIEIGVENTGRKYKQYETFWFPLGIFVLSNPSLTHDQGGVKISLKLNDKMSLLNGEFGGAIPIATYHSPVINRNQPVDSSKTEEENLTFAKEQILVSQAIQTLITTYSEIPESQIIVEDLETRIKNSVRWEKAPVKEDQNAANEVKATSADSSGPLYLYKDENGWNASLTKPEEIEDILEFNIGDTVGYQNTDFRYPDTLESSTQDNVVTMLDKVKNRLGNYEYFFDVDGIFHFQAIDNFLTEGSEVDDLASAIEDKYLSNLQTKDKSVYSFKDGKFNVSYNNNPMYTNIKNDITVWGEREGAPIRYHLVVDIPEPTHSYNYNTYKDSYGVLRAKDVRLSTERDAYRPKDTRMNLYLYYLAQDTNGNLIAKDAKSVIAQELIEYWPTVYNVDPYNPGFLTDDLLTLKYFFDIIDVTRLITASEIANISISSVGRLSRVFDKGKDINCIFENNKHYREANLIFLKEADSTIEDDDVRLENEKLECANKNQEYIVVSTDIFERLQPNRLANPAHDFVRSVLHEYIGHNNTISLSTIPIYHLDVNTRISVEDEASDIHGDYIINSITIPLTPSGKMNISAQKALEMI